MKHLRQYKDSFCTGVFTIIIGQRLAAFELKDIYGKDVYATGPMPKSAVSKMGRIVITYDCNGALKIMDSKQYADTVTDGKIKSGETNPDILNEFELAGEDGKWYEATAQITSENQVTVYSENVLLPTRVRYGYEDYPEAPNLTDISDLPSYVFEISAELSDEDSEGVIILGAEKDSVKITAYSDIEEAVIVAVSYNDGILDGITMSDKTKLCKGTNTVQLSR